MSSIQRSRKIGHADKNGNQTIRQILIYLETYLMKDSMMLSKYLDYWIRYRNSSYSINTPLLYLKDWHCVKKNPNIFMYEVPQYFASDWLNEYYMSHAELDDDYMFVYMGPRGTWTPFHVDVFTSYSWSANIVGKKRWLLFPPGEENHLCDIQGQLIYDATSEELNDHSKYREYDHDSLKCYELIQDPGQIVFVPSGWHHQVWNLEDTISVNHNWINGCNVWNMWLTLKKELLAVIKEVNDCRDMNDWTGHCQLMLKTLYGMDYIQFYDFLSFIATKRLEQIIKKEPIISFKKWYLGINHCLFDLRQIKAVLEDFIKDTKEKSILIYLNDKAQELLCKINGVL